MIKRQPESGPVIDPAAEQPLSDRYGPIVATGGSDGRTRRESSTNSLLGWLLRAILLLLVVAAIAYVAFIAAASAILAVATMPQAKRTPSDSWFALGAVVFTLWAAGFTVYRLFLYVRKFKTERADNTLRSSDRSTGFIDFGDGFD